MYLCVKMMHMDTRPLLLLTNDDGYNAPGLLALMEALKPIGDLLVVAPDGGRSGMSAAITVSQPLELRLVSESEGVTVYKSNGTPVDCVKLALAQLCKERAPDALFSGINHGTNASVAIHYSGTLGAVIEACLNRIPAAGFSLDDHDHQADFSPSLPYIQQIATRVLERGLPFGTCLNVNVPKCSALKGVRICRQTKGRWIEEFDQRKHPKGGNYYWLTGNFHNDEPESTDTDMTAMREGYISVVPSQIDMTAYDLIPALNDWF